MVQLVVNHADKHEKCENEDVMPLEAIPYHIQLEILEKFTYPEYYEFSQCNYYANAICASNPSICFEEQVHRLTFYKDREEVSKSKHEVIIRYPLESVKRARLIPTTLEIKTDLTDEYCDHVIRTLIQKKIKPRGITIEASICCDRRRFEYLLSIVGNDTIQLPPRTAREYLRSDRIFEAKMLCMLEGSSVSDQFLTNLKANELRLYGTRVSTAGITTFFKQWLDGLRDIHHFFLVSERNINSQEIIASFGDNCTAESRQLMLTRSTGEKLVVTFGWSVMAFLWKPE